MSVGEIAEAHETMIPGIAARADFHIFDMPKIADMIGVKDRKYLDLTARFEQRISETSCATLCPALAEIIFSSLPTLPPERSPPASESCRPSDEQLYALARYVYSLQPPKNPNLPKTRAMGAGQTQVSSF